MIATYQAACPPVLVPYLEAMGELAGQVERTLHRDL